MICNTATTFFLAALLVHSCDLRVILRDYSGRPTDTQVAIVDMKGTELASVNSQKGIAEFCDLGMVTFNIIVGGDACGQVYVRRLSVRPGFTREVPIYFRNCHGFSILQGCEILLRVKDQHGAVVSGAVVSAGSLSLRTDRFGRVRIPVDTSSESYVTVTASGLARLHTALTCGKEYQLLERTLTMHSGDGNAR